MMNDLEFTINKIVKCHGNLHNQSDNYIDNKTRFLAQDYTFWQLNTIFNNIYANITISCNSINLL